MKKFLLLLSVFTVSTIAYGQQIYTHYTVDYGASTSYCLKNFPNTGGYDVADGNVASSAYNPSGTPMNFLQVTAGGSIDTSINRAPGWWYIYEIDGNGNCGAMANDASLIDVTSKVVKITASSNINNTVLFFYMGYGTGTSITKGTYQGNAKQRIVLSTTPTTYTLDYSSNPNWATASGDSVCYFGLIMGTPSSVVDITTIEFGAAAVTGITKPTLTNALSVYPNPSAGSVVVNTHNRAGKVQVMNPLGAVVETIETTTATDSYQLSIANKGLYFLNFTTDEGTAVEKLVIE